jgi:hypothetical protein
MMSYILSNMIFFLPHIISRIPLGTDLGILAFVILPRPSSILVSQITRNLTGGRMRRFFLKISLPVILLMITFLMARIQSAHANESRSEVNQQPTVAIPTVTGTPIGPYIIVVSDPEEQINVRTGPGTDYPKIGVLLNRQQVPALGRLPGGTWIKIVYPGSEDGFGWVYAPLTQVFGDLPMVEVPPTPTPRVTPTIDPTLASQFVVDLPATRMPTYTPPPQLVIPTFPADEIPTGTGGVPMGFVITGLAVVGFFGLILSLLRRR